MEDRRSPSALTIAAGVVAAVILLSLLCRPSDPSTELARTAREAVELARDADTGVRSAVLWSGRLRLLAIVLGVSVPLVIAYLIWRSSAQSEVDAAEILEAADRLSLPGPGQGTTEKLPAKEREALPADTDSEAPPASESCRSDGQITLGRAVIAGVGSCQGDEPGNRCRRARQLVAALQLNWGRSAHAGGRPVYTKSPEIAEI